MHAHMEVFDMNNEEHRRQVEEIDRMKAASDRRGQQIYARIKRTSKYYGQGEKGALFPVYIRADYGDYHVSGGPGGQYRMRDVALYVISDGKELRISG